MASLGTALLSRSAQPPWPLWWASPQPLGWRALVISSLVLKGWSGSGVWAGQRTLCSPRGSGLWLMRARQGGSNLSQRAELAKAGRVSRERAGHPLPKKV